PDQPGRATPPRPHLARAPARVVAPAARLGRSRDRGVGTAGSAENRTCARATRSPPCADGASVRGAPPHPVAPPGARGEADRRPRRPDRRAERSPAGTG